MEWISIKDRMPKFDETVLLLNKNREVSIGTFGKLRVTLTITAEQKKNNDCNSAITHWMLLPPIPKIDDHA